jgi:hypothetical protein
MLGAYPALLKENAAAPGEAKTVAGQAPSNEDLLGIITATRSDDNKQSELN